MLTIGKIKRKENPDVESLGKVKQRRKPRKQDSDYYELSEKDFYPPEDTRYYRSGVSDISGGDNFADYAEYFFDTYGKEIFDY